MLSLHAAAQAAPGDPEDLHEERGGPVVLEEEGVPFLQAAARANDFHPCFKNMKPVGVNTVTTQEGPLQQPSGCSHTPRGACSAISLAKASGSRSQVQGSRCMLTTNSWAASAEWLHA